MFFADSPLLCLRQFELFFYDRLIEAQATVGVQWLTVKLIGWERNNWIGHEHAAQCAGALGQTHGLLQHAMRHLNRTHRPAAEGSAWQVEAGKQQQNCVDFVT